MRFSPDFLDEIRARVPISAVVGQRVTFDRKKSNPARGDFWGCCPFHGEKTPSFHCEDPKGRYHCFGCGVTGDHFRFLTELDGLNFHEAVERLAAQAGLPMPVEDVESARREKAKATLYDVMSMAAAFFEEKLKSDVGSHAKQYLRGRELTAKTIASFRIGFAPDGRNILKDHLIGKGVTLKQMEDCGLLVSGQDIAVPYDRFRNRIMFPIEDLRGRIVGFGGRALAADAAAKYLNSPETELFHKGHMLYHAANARKAVQPHAGNGPKPLIVVEGYMDVIALAQAGIHQAVAPLGTALTEEQLQLLWRFSHDPILCFDGDDAGLKAAFRALERALPLLKADISLRFALLPEGQDPDDLVRKGGANAFTQVLHAAKPLSELLWLRETAGRTFDTPEKRAGLEKSLNVSVHQIKDENLRRYYQQDVRERLHAFFRPEYTKKNDWKRKGEKRQVEDPGINASLAKTNMMQSAGQAMPMREAALMLVLINHPMLWDDDFEHLASLELTSSHLQRLHHILLDILAEWQPHDASAMREMVEKKGEGALLTRLDGMIRNAGMRSAFISAPIEDARTTLNQALTLHLRAHNLHKRLHDVEIELLENPTEEGFANLKRVKEELAKNDTVAALIEGFGTWNEEENTP